MNKNLLELSEIGLHSEEVGSSVYIMTEQKKMLAEIADDVIYVDEKTLSEIYVFDVFTVMDSFNASGKNVVLV